MKTSQVSLATAAMTALLTAPAGAQPGPSVAPAGTFKELQREQRALVERWVAEYKTVFHQPMKPEEIYNKLPVSARTTFQAVTHALMNSKLTSQDGQPMGTALDLVDVVERVAGQVPGTRGDRQFRAYVYLKPGALNKLYTAKEFVRGHDNAVYHIGYPINFRQQGGAPSLQFSVARSGRRADIDVDYRSSSPAKALVNGHLSSANSDVRAGNNPATHNRRWSGLSNWWRDLMAVFVEQPSPEESVDGFAPGAEAERRRLARGPLPELMNGYLTDWLIQQKPEQLLPLVSVKAFPCVAEFQGDARPDSKLALLRILRRMQQRNKALGNVTRLEDVVTPVSYRLPDSVPVSHAYSKLFAIQEVPDDVAWAIDCRVRFKMSMAESIPRPPHRLDKTFVVSMRVKDPAEPQAFLVQTWKQEAGEWRLISFDVKRKTLSPPADLLTKADPLPSPDSDAGRVATEMEKLVDVWLMQKKPAEAARFFLPESYGCDAFAEGPHNAEKRKSPPTDSKLLLAFLEEAAKNSLPYPKMVGVIAAVEAGHPDLRLISHKEAGAFLLAEVSGELLRGAECGSVMPRRPSAAAPPGARGMMTAFRLVNTSGEESAGIQLYWKKSPDGWRVSAYAVTVD